MLSSSTIQYTLRSLIKGEGRLFFQDFFGQNHTTFSCKTSILQETVDQFDHYRPWLALLIQNEHFKHLYPLLFRFLNFSSDPP